MAARVGVDGLKIPRAEKRDSIGNLQFAKSLGLEGVFFRSVLHMSPVLDGAVLGDIRDCADELGLYLETGLGKINPYANAENPELRLLGDGDIVLGFRRMMEACAKIGCLELWSGAANFKTAFVGRFGYDRFRTDVTWDEQIDAIIRFLSRLAPVARDLGIHINIETHEEITSFEILRIIEAVGSDVVGVVFDTGNVLQRAEHPILAAERLAPYVRQTQIKDAILEIVNGAVEYQSRVCGEGVIAFDELMPILLQVNPDLTLSLETLDLYEDRPRPVDSIRIDLFDSEWLAGHPDLTLDEYGRYLRMLTDFQERIVSGEVESVASYSKKPYLFDDAVRDLNKSAQHIRESVALFETQSGTE